MSDLRNRLEQSLSSSYSFERELGGGGMSRVFVAEETALGRKVVVKVLSPELAEGLSAERFAREIKVAARLQQANIVPVLTTGSIDSLPYYTMPYVAGESLRHRMAAGPIPPGEAIAVLRDVAKALAHAHAAGVVHRDIKPENILLSGGTAVVTDFGIAKAIAASRTGEMEGALPTMLTGHGASIGTPAYMSPEQASGDPGTDARADIYAWGVMAYELLAGTHPFASRKNLSELIRAHMVETPVALSVVAPNVPPSLATLVMRCVEKLPNSRPSDALELVSTLETVDSSTGVHAAKATQKLSAALALYVLGAIVIAGLAKVSVTAVGLPEWTFPGAVAVLALGAFMMLATAFGGPITLKTARRGGVVAGALFAIAIGGFMAMRAFGIGPFGSLIGQGTLGDRDRIVIADMTGPASDTALGSVFADAMRTLLSESRSVRLMSSDRVQQVLMQMQVAPGKPLDAALARQVATRAGARAVLDGDVRTIGSTYVLSVRLLPTEPGEELATLQETAKSEDEFIEAASRLAKRLRAKIGESLRSVNAATPLDQVTTASLDALRKYTSGRRAIAAGEYLKGAALLGEAIAIDTTFAMAQRGLATFLGEASFQGDMAARLLQKAYDNRGRLSPLEQLAIEMQYWAYGPTVDFAKAVTAGEAALAINPEDPFALSEMVRLSRNLRQYERVVDFGNRSLAADSSRLIVCFNLAQAHAELQRVDSAEVVLARCAATGTPHPALAFIQAQLALLQRRDDDAIRITDQLIQSGNPIAFEWGNAVRSGIEVLHGRIRAGLRYADAFLDAAERRGARTMPLIKASETARANFYGDSVGVVRSLDSALARLPLESFAPLDRPYFDLGWNLAYVGRPDRAKQYLADLERVHPTAVTVFGNRTVPLLRGGIARAEGRWTDALRDFRIADSLGCSKCVTPNIAEAFDRAGNADSAVAMYERYVRSTSIDFAIFIDQLWVPFAYKRLGALYEAKGDLAKARKYYASFVDLWADADPELQPQVRAVRDRLRVIGAQDRN